MISYSTVISRELIEELSFCVVLYSVRKLNALKKQKKLKWMLILG